MIADKRNISSAETFVLDDGDLEDLDNVSLTGILQDVPDAIKEIESEAENIEESTTETHK